MKLRLPLLCLLTMHGLALAAPRPDPFDPAAMDAVFQRLGGEFVKNDRTDALSIAVVKRGKIRFYNFGTSSRERPQPPTEHTVYEIGSISKVFGSLMLAHAVLEKKVRLDDDVRAYLPGEYANLTYGGVPVRLIDLVDTTSALPDNLPDFKGQAADAGPDEVPFLVRAGLLGYSEAQRFDDLKSAKLVDRPGKVPRHSNLAADLVATVLERVYREPYEQLLARFIEKPLGMAAGTGEARAGLVAKAYSKRRVEMPPMTARAAVPSGGLRYSAADLARFLLAQVAAKDPAIGLTHRPAWGDPAEGAVGFNWKLGQTAEGEPMLNTSGGTFGFSSYIELRPALGYGIVLLANRPGEAQNELETLANQALVALVGKAPALAALEAAIDGDDGREARELIAEVKRTHPKLHLSEAEVNTWGYKLLASKREARALSFFRYNTEQHPTSSNPFDSLAEGYEQVGDRPKALANYRRSLELDPQNAHGAERIRVLEAAEAPDAGHR
jgi:CubicO group peptidase (beta-lactamase class C family)